MKNAVIIRTALAGCLLAGLLAGCAPSAGKLSVQPLDGEAVFLANPRQVTSEGKTGEGYFSPGGTRIIFQSIRGDHPFYQIYTMRCGLPYEPAGPATRVSTGHGRTTCAFYKPRLKKIIYASSHLDPNRAQAVADELAYLEEVSKDPSKRRGYAWDFDPHMDIFEADPDGSNLKRLTDTEGYDAEGAYSPDGKHIVFCSYRNGNGDIFIMDADGSHVRPLTDSPGYDGGPFFSPDGKRIIYRAEVKDDAGKIKEGLLQIFVINADGTGRKQLTDNNDVNFGPYWHPDGKHVIFATSRHGHRNYELYLLNIETGAEYRVTYTPGADVLPVFSRDGRKLMWTSKRGRNDNGQYESQLWIADWVWSGE